LKEILRGKWRFKGHVVSDCWAIQDFHKNHQVTQTPEESAALALNAGCDLNCGCTYPELAASYKKGLVSMEAIDTALTRLLRTRFKLGMFDPPEQSPWADLDRKVINCDRHRDLAKKAAERSIVLLKNAGGLLPLDRRAKKFLVTGPGAANAHVLFGNYYGISPRFVTILEGLGMKVQDKYGINLEYRQGCLQYEENHLGNVPFGLSNAADVIIAVFGLDGAMEGEEGDAIASDSNGDRERIELPSWQLAYLRQIRATGKPLLLILTGGSPIAFPEDIADAILFAWYPGERGGEAVADILFGDTVPSGKLPLTFPASTEQLPPYEDYAMRGRTYRYMKEKPLYPFGFGLSYTSFHFDELSLSTPKIAAGGSVTARLKLSNTGTRDAEEVVQIYVSRDGVGVDEPANSLRAFRRVLVPAGKTVELDFVLPAAAFETVNNEGESVLLPGAYIVTAADAAPLPVSVERGAAKPVSAKAAVG
jgi:beta-glucosidase